MSDFLFEVPEVKSPRLLWMGKHSVQTRNYSNGTWFVFNDQENAWGFTEDEALTQLALKLGIKLWNEEGGQL